MPTSLPTSLSPSLPLSPSLSLSLSPSLSLSLSLPLPLSFSLSISLSSGQRKQARKRDCDLTHLTAVFILGLGVGGTTRSLQTIISWFVLNNYVNKKVPGHREIQQTLVNIGDKPATFVGSKQWIGAIEISFILDTLLDISSKVLTFNSGAEIPTKAREIAHHFETQGTPIMIGGGVLAYTLLGIDYNESTGECAFLILDPHYTEGEDINKITAGAWVGWKRLGDNAAAGGDLFVKSAFYNFLCPQRPVTV